MDVRRAARGAGPAAFDARGLPAAAVAPRSTAGGIPARRAWSAGRIVHHGLRAVCVLAVAAALPQGAATMQTPPRTVPAIDLQKYVGTYYEAARFPNRFQKQCVADVTATYVLRPDGRLDVINRCRKEDGSTDQARGIAKRARGDASGARLKVRFAPAWLSLLPAVWGDYWVLGVGPAYSYAVIGGPQRDYLWILSRLPRMPDLAYQQAVEIASSNGYDVSRLVKTRQGGGD